MTRSLSVLAGLGMVAALAAAPANAELIYNGIPSPLPGNLPSLGYQATSTSEFGDYVQFAGTDRQLASVSVVMSNWAKYSTWAGSHDSGGFSLPITLTLYNNAGTLAAPPVGSAIATRTITPTILWRPEHTGDCGGDAYRSTDGNCYNGLAQVITFDFSNEVVPDDLIFGISYNTQSYGASPIGTDGPYNSLNVGLITTGPTIGTDLNPDAVFWNTAHAGFLTTGTVNVFSEDSNWAPYSLAVAFEVPEPASLMLLGSATLGLFGLRRVRTARKAA